MQISEVAQHRQEFNDTGQIRVFEIWSQALHVIEFYYKETIQCDLLTLASSQSMSFALYKQFQ